MDSKSKDLERSAEDLADARREFLTKAAAAVAALAGAALIAGVASEEADAATASSPALAGAAPIPIRQAPLSYQKLANGHAFELTSTELTNVLAREGLISNSLLGKQSLMRLALLYSP